MKDLKVSSASLKDKESLLNERLEGVEASKRQGIFAACPRASSINATISYKSHDQLRDKYEGLLSETEAFSDRLESLFSLLGGPTQSGILIFFESLPAQFSYTIVYKIPPMRLFSWGTSFVRLFCTHLVLNYFPSRLILIIVIHLM